MKSGVTLGAQDDSSLDSFCMNRKPRSVVFPYPEDQPASGTILLIGPQITFPVGPRLFQPK